MVFGGGTGGGTTTGGVSLEGELAFLRTGLRPFDGIAEYQVVIFQKTEMTELHLRIEPQSGADATALANEITETFRTQLNLRVPVETVPPESLPRFELKAKRWIKE